MNDLTTHDRDLAADVTRDANDRIASKARRLHFTARIPFLCECEDPHCRDLVLLAPDGFDAVRRDGGTVLAAGHAGGSGAGAAELEQTG